MSLDFFEDVQVPDYSLQVGACGKCCNARFSVCGQLGGGCGRTHNTQPPAVRAEADAARSHAQTRPDAKRHTNLLHPTARGRARARCRGAQDPSLFDSSEGLWRWAYEGNDMYMDLQVGRAAAARVAAACMV